MVTPTDMPKGVYQRTESHRQALKEAWAKRRAAGKLDGLFQKGSAIRNTGRTRFKPGMNIGAANYAWKGGVISHAAGYRQELTGSGHRLQHRLVMEKQLGRTLKRKEIVHHWDEERTNNRPENLQFFRHVTAHLRIHHFANRHGISVSALKFAQPWLLNS